VDVYLFGQARRVGGQARHAMQEISLFVSTQPTVSVFHTVYQWISTDLDKLDMLEDTLDVPITKIH
jgi:hypothetical protein